MMYRTIVLTVAALSSTQVLSSTEVLAGDLPSVYVAPGGVYIGSAQVYVTPGPRHGEPPYAAPTYDPGYLPPGHVRRAPAYYAPAYEEFPSYGGREPVYYGREPGYGRGPVYGPSPYGVDYAPRPPAHVPYGSRCYVDRIYGRVTYCN